MAQDDSKRLSLNVIILEIDKILALLGCIIAPILVFYTQVILKNYLYTFIVVMSFFACLAYLGMRKSFSKISFLPRVQTKFSFYLSLNILFLLLFICSMLALYLRPEVYVRPLAYFILIALMSVVVGIEILYKPVRKVYSYFILLQIILIALSLQWSELLIFPTLVGKDPFTHRIFTLDMLNSGYIPGGNDYSKLPVFHLITGSTSLITGLNYKMATMLSIGLLQVVCDVLFIFLLGRFMFTDRVGILGALFVGIANRHLQMGFWAIPNTIAAVFIPIIIYLLFKIGKEDTYRGAFLAMFFMAALILTHTVTAMWMAILLLIFWIGFGIYNAVYHEHRMPATLTITTLFTVAMLGWWIYASGHISKLSSLMRWGFSIDKTMNVTPMCSMPFSEQLFDYSGMFLFYAVSFIGCFYMLSKYGNSYRFSMAVGCLVTISISFFGQLFGRYIITGRWEYFSYLVLAIPLAIAIFLLCVKIKSEIGKVSLVSIFIFSLTFFMIMSPVANIDNPMFSPTATHRYAFADSEIQAAKTVSSVGGGRIYMDGYYTNVGCDFAPVKSIRVMLCDKNFNRCKNMPILIRKEIRWKPVDMKRSLVKLDYDPSEFLTEQGFSRIYDCDTVYAYCKSG